MTNGPVCHESLSYTHFGLGAYHLMAGSSAEAQAHLEVSLAFFRTIDDVPAIVDTLIKLGFAAQAQWDLSSAVAHFREGIELARTHQYRRGIAADLFGLAGVALEQDELGQSARLFGAAEALSEMTSGVDTDERYLNVRNIAALRDRLDPTRLEFHWAEGRALDWEQAVEEALAICG